MIPCANFVLKNCQRGPSRPKLAYRFMSTMAGNVPGFEEATRAFFTNDAERFAEFVQGWPADVRDHAMVLASRAMVAPP